MRRAPALCCVLLAAAVAVAGCTSSSEAGTVSLTVSPAPASPSDGPVLPSGPASDSGAEVQVGGDVPASWPDVVPLPSGGTLQTYTLSEDGRFLNAVFILDGSVEEVAAAYDAALVAAGYTATTSDMADGVSIADYTGPDAELNATVADGAGKTNLFVNVTLTPDV